MRAAVEESLMKRIRQIVVALVGLFYVGLLYPLCTELWHSKWLVEMHDNECEPMFITFLVALGVFLLLAVRRPSGYRLVIAFAAFHGLAHSATMLIQSIETSMHGVPRGYDDVILFGVIGIALLFCIPPKEETRSVL
jgi:hydrogenase/urease accessory protein HupE